MENTKEILEGIEFFDLMQAYRIADPTDQDRVCKKFEDVKDWINEKFIKQNEKMRVFLTRQIVIEKFDCKYVHSAISRERHKIRLDKLKSLLKEIK